jgi:predicted nucleic acid-binding protein
LLVVISQSHLSAQIASESKIGLAMTKPMKGSGCMIVFLDTNILSLVTAPGNQDKIVGCQVWLETLAARSIFIITSEICAYEINCGLLEKSLRQSKNVEGLQNLEELRDLIEFLPVTRQVLERASQIWTQAKLQSQPMSHPERLDADAIICAQWQLLDEHNPERAVTIATKNLRDLGRFANANLWSDIKP